MVAAIKSEPQCKLCRHPQRPDIDNLLELRARRTKGPDGKLAYTLEVVLAKLAEWGVQNPTSDNVKYHWRKHCEMTDEGGGMATGAAVALNQEEMLAILDAAPDSEEGFLLSVVGLSKAQLRAKILRGENPGITVDHSLKAIAELTKRSHNQAQHDLLTAITGGIAVALSKPEEPRQIGPADFEIIDAEEVES